jgi:outer membrane immunogenic protein
MCQASCFQRTLERNVLPLRWQRLGTGTIAIDREFCAIAAQTRKLAEPTTWRRARRNVSRSAPGERSTQRMKNWILVLACLPMVAAVAHAQESRQDASVSYSGLFTPEVVGNAVHQTATVGDLGVLGSYRYQLTPHGAAEANYGYQRYINKFLSNAGPTRAHTQLQEFSAEYVYSAFSYHNIFPFIEGGIGGYFFGIINDNKTSYQGPLKSSVEIGIPYGGGFAYEISPSFDFRAEYRGIIVKAPDFGAPENFTKTGRYENLFNPVVGVAYHF